METGNGARATPWEPLEDGSLFDLPAAEAGASPRSQGAGGARRPGATEARRSLQYMLEAAFEYGRVGSLGQLLSGIAALREYRPFNAMLLLVQLPSATRLLAAHRWDSDFGRVIRANQQPVVALQPGGPVMFLFDVSQTDPGPHARPLPAALRNPYGMTTWPGAEAALAGLIEQCKHDGVRVLTARLGKPFAGHIVLSRARAAQTVVTNRRTGATGSVAVRYETALNESYSTTERLATLAHEVGHLYCGHLGPVARRNEHPDPLVVDRSGLDEPTKELEAESVARIVFQTLAPDTPLPDHLSQYFAAEPDLEELSLEAVLVASGWVLDMANGRPPQGDRGKRR